jgi:hypothetical protein
MSDQVYVVQEAPTGQWIAECIDTRCEDTTYANGPHELAYTPRKATADAAATRHRRFLRTLPVHDDKPRTGICGNCGEPTDANAKLRQLVADLERRLAQHEHQEAS